MIGDMQEFIEILNARAKQPEENQPIYIAEFNGMRLEIDVETHQDFDTAAAALEAATALARELLAVPGWVPVSAAKLGAFIDVVPPHPGSEEPNPLWRGHVSLLLTTDDLFAQDREFPFHPVHGIVDPE